MSKDKKKIVPSRQSIPVTLTTARVHPGELLKYEFLEPMGLDVDSFARHIGVESETVADVCNEKAPITLEIALRLGRALGTTSQFWLNAQHAYDDSQELQRLQSTGKIEAVELITPMNNEQW